MSTRWTWHGGGLGAARAHFGEGALPWLDLSTGINPQPWPHAESLAIDWQSLPDEGALRDLERAAAEHFGCDPAHVCAVPGTEVGLRLTGDLLGQASAFHLTPTYRTHGEIVAGSREIALSEVEKADGETLILANPNNPDGRLLEPATLMAWLARRGAKGWLIVDEAFADCHEGMSLAGEVSDHRRLLVFRSFGKFFGLAGVRLGFVIGPRDVLVAMRARLGAWPVSSAAIAIGTAAYRDTAWIAATRTRLVEDAAALDRDLAKLGYEARGSCPLFRLIDCGDAQALFDHLARHAILTRPFDAEPRWLRLGLPPGAEARERLLSVLALHG
ncbi:threonine-phosphate decarboxylase CobD [Novosphingobium sp. 9]|uniref:threonine-phosphate decarboxylase CobD n=1 Tax=Novosphingobium sp. 9 TaxID=2025349 RepID=UPI0021B5D806|nr:threonine-phosphate decarboxylase CobD [Novosphingobium sp. 9]